MSNNETTLRKPLRLWPGVALAVLLVLDPLRRAPLFPDGAMIGAARIRGLRRADLVVVAVLQPGAVARAHRRRPPDDRRRVRDLLRRPRIDPGRNDGQHAADHPCRSGAARRARGLGGCHAPPVRGTAPRRAGRDRPARCAACSRSSGPTACSAACRRSRGGGRRRPRNGCSRKRSLTPSRRRSRLRRADSRVAGSSSSDEDPRGTAGNQTGEKPAAPRPRLRRRRHRLPRPSGPACESKGLP